MIWWILLMVVMLMGAIAGVIYLITRFARFIPHKIWLRLGKKRYLIGLIPVIPFIIYSVLDPVNGVIVTVHVLIIWAICDLIGHFIKKCISSRSDNTAVMSRGTVEVSVYGEAEDDLSSHTWWDGFYIAGIAAILLSAAYLGTGWYLAHHVVETDYSLVTSKELGVDSIRIAHISDSHVGACFDGDGFTKHMETVQATNPDMVVITGDYVDDDTTREDMIKSCEALGRLDTKYGIYYIYGNHDKGYFNTRDFDDADMRAELTKAGVIILEDQSVDITDGITLIGRQDRSEEQRGNGRADMATLTKDMDINKYNILLDHQPNDFDNEQASGVDLVLSGHTHGGQLIPVGFLGEWSGTNDKTYGLEVRGDTTFIVNSGIGDWAIEYKTGTKAEFGIIDIKKA